jgi:copper chaperone
MATTVTLTIPDMNCGHCKANVEKAIASVDPDACVAIDIPARKAEIESSAALSDLQAALAAKGYESSPAA